MKVFLALDLPGNIDVIKSRFEKIEDISVETVSGIDEALALCLQCKDSILFAGCGSSDLPYDEYVKKRIENALLDFEKDQILSGTALSFISVNFRKPFCEVRRLFPHIRTSVGKCLYRTGDEIIDDRDGELFVILPDTDISGAGVICDKMRRTLKGAEPFFGMFSCRSGEFTSDEILDRVRQDAVRKRIIVIVDDHPQVLRFMRGRLEKDERFDCVCVGSGQELLSLLEKNIPDLIVLDIVMRGMSGYEVVGRLKEEHRFRNIPIVLMSSLAHLHTFADPVSVMAHPGSIPVVSKTEGFHHLMEIIDSVL